MVVGRQKTVKPAGIIKCTLVYIPRIFCEKSFSVNLPFIPSGQERQDFGGFVCHETHTAVAEKKIPSPGMQAPEVEGIAKLVESARCKGIWFVRAMTIGNKFVVRRLGHSLFNTQKHVG